MDQVTEDIDPRDAIARLEARIEALQDKIENCRKFEAAAKLAMLLGGALMIALIVRVVPSDPLTFIAAIAAGLGGIVLAGTNSSTRRQALADLAAAEAERAALIGAIDLRVVRGGETVH
jgi:hypothetical protein